MTYAPLDRIAATMRPMAQLLPERRAHDAIAALAVAHFDAVLKGSRDAARFLATDLPEALAGRGARASVVEPGKTRGA